MNDQIITPIHVIARIALLRGKSDIFILLLKTLQGLSSMLRTKFLTVTLQIHAWFTPHCLLIFSFKILTLSPYTVAILASLDTLNIPSMLLSQELCIYCVSAYIISFPKNFHGFFSLASLQSLMRCYLFSKLYTTIICKTATFLSLSLSLHYH